MSVFKILEPERLNLVEWNGKSTVLLQNTSWLMKFLWLLLLIKSGQLSETWNPYENLI